MAKGDSNSYIDAFIENVDDGVESSYIDNVEFLYISDLDYDKVLAGTVQEELTGLDIATVSTDHDADLSAAVVRYAEADPTYTAKSVLGTDDIVAYRIPVEPETMIGPTTIAEFCRYREIPGDSVTSPSAYADYVINNNGYINLYVDNANYDCFNTKDGSLDSSVLYNYTSDLNKEMAAFSVRDGSDKLQDVYYEYDEENKEFVMYVDANNTEYINAINAYSDSDSTLKITQSTVEDSITLEEQKALRTDIYDEVYGQLLQKKFYLDDDVFVCRTQDVMEYEEYQESSAFLIEYNGYYSYFSGSSEDVENTIQSCVDYVNNNFLGNIDEDTKNVISSSEFGIVYSLAIDSKTSNDTITYKDKSGNTYELNNARDRSGETLYYEVIVDGTTKRMTYEEITKLDKDEVTIVQSKKGVPKLYYDNGNECNVEYASFEEVCEESAIRKAGIVDVTANEDGSFSLYYENGQWINVPVGEDGLISVSETSESIKNSVEYKNNKATEILRSDTRFENSEIDVITIENSNGTKEYNIIIDGVTTKLTAFEFNDMLNNNSISPLIHTSIESNDNEYIRGSEFKNPCISINDTAEYEMVISGLKDLSEKIENQKSRYSAIIGKAQGAGYTVNFNVAAFDNLKKQCTNLEKQIRKSLDLLEITDDSCKLMLDKIIEDFFTESDVDSNIDLSNEETIDSQMEEFFKYESENVVGEVCKELSIYLGGYVPLSEASKEYLNSLGILESDMTGNMISLDLLNNSLQKKYSFDNIYDFIYTQRGNEINDDLRLALFKSEEVMGYYSDYALALDTMEKYGTFIEKYGKYVVSDDFEKNMDVVEKNRQYNPDKNIYLTNAETALLLTLANDSTFEKQNFAKNVYDRVCGDGGWASTIWDANLWADDLDCLGKNKSNLLDEITGNTIEERIGYVNAIKNLEKIYNDESSKGNWANLFVNGFVYGLESIPRNMWHLYEPENTINDWKQDFMADMLLSSYTNDELEQRYRNGEISLAEMNLLKKINAADNNSMKNDEGVLSPTLNTWKSAGESAGVITDQVLITILTNGLATKLGNYFALNGVNVLTTGVSDNLGKFYSDIVKYATLSASSGGAMSNNLYNETNNRDFSRFMGILWGAGSFAIREFAVPKISDALKNRFPELSKYYTVQYGITVFNEGDKITPVLPIGGDTSLNDLLNITLTESQAKLLNSALTNAGNIAFYPTNAVLGFGQLIFGGACCLTQGRWLDSIMPSVSDFSLALGYVVSAVTNEDGVGATFATDVYSSTGYLVADLIK